jgi:hypothetical protein
MRVLADLNLSRNKIGCKGAIAVSKSVIENANS